MAVFSNSRLLQNLYLHKHNIHLYKVQHPDRICHFLHSSFHHSTLFRSTIRQLFLKESL
nr:MAG TPA: hypothetical protein [Bacteriophage sp.]DAT92569.1 MAG TPA: hypothetical protein [Caudoviricetes sp.]